MEVWLTKTEKGFELVALGESLIDFTPCGRTEQGISLFAQNPGGAPANVLAMFAKLGGRGAFIGKVGRDAFGDFLRQTMNAAGIDCRGLITSRKYPTTLAFVHLDENGERSFSFYRKPGADVRLKWGEVDRSLLGDCGIFHFGGVSLTDEPAAGATLNSATYAKSRGALISYDPNYRAPLWDSEARAAEKLREGLALDDIVKVNGEELALLTGKDTAEGARQILQAGAVAVFVTLGGDGAYLLTPNGGLNLPAFDVNTTDTTGAGDAFIGAVLYRVRGKTAEDLKRLSIGEWRDILEFGSAAGALATTAGGAIPAMPDGGAIAKLIGG